MTFTINAGMGGGGIVWISGHEATLSRVSPHKALLASDADTLSSFSSSHNPFQAHKTSVTSRNYSNFPSVVSRILGFFLSGPFNNGR